MATPIARFDALCNALTDPDVLTDAQKLVIGNAFLSEATDANILAAVPNAPLLPDGKTVDRAAITASQKALIVLARLRYYTRMVVLTVRRRTDEAAAEAAIAAGQAAASAEGGV